MCFEERMLKQGAHITNLIERQDEEDRADKEVEMYVKYDRKKLYPGNKLKPDS